MGRGRMGNGTKAHQETGKKGFLFNVDILVEGYNNGIALETLLSILNHARIKDYKINSGMELGKIIEAALQERKAEEGKMQEQQKKSTPAPKAEEPKNGNRDIFNLIDYFRNNNTLVRLSVIKGKGVKLSIPCRILNFDQATHNLTVYHVDEKKVYQFHVHEIDDFNVS